MLTSSKLTRLDIATLNCNDCFILCLSEKFHNSHFRVLSGINRTIPTETVTTSYPASYPIDSGANLAQTKQLLKSRQQAPQAR